VKVKKAVIPAAGFGTRFLPWTKAMPKEMLPIVDKPVIQMVVEELVEAGIEDIIIVTGYHKRSIEDHFDDPSSELWDVLLAGGEKKKPMLEEVERIGKMANFVYVRQKGPYGNGTPLLNVRHLLEDEPFFYLWGDDFFMASPSRARQMLSIYDEFGCSVLGCIKARDDSYYKRYGIAAGDWIREGVMNIRSIVEKPGKDNAPSDLCTISCLLTPEIFEYLDRCVSGLQDNQELYYNDMMKMMLNDGKKIVAKEIVGGEYFDTGDKLEYLKTVVQFGVKHPDLGEDFRLWLRDFKDFTG
jgi:UTP--glucose-1-phosphate uridylyltransferase